MWLGVDTGSRELQQFVLFISVSATLWYDVKVIIYVNSYRNTNLTVDCTKRHTNNSYLLKYGSYMIVIEFCDRSLIEIILYGSKSEKFVRHHASLTLFITNKEL